MFTTLYKNADVKGMALNVLITWGKISRDWSFFIMIFQSLSIVIVFDYFTDKYGHWFLNNGDIQDWFITGIGHSALEHYICTSRVLCFPGGAGGKEPTYQCRRRQRQRFDS